MTNERERGPRQSCLWNLHTTSVKQEIWGQKTKRWLIRMLEYVWQLAKMQPFFFTCQSKHGRILIWLSVHVKQVYKERFLSDWTEVNWFTEKEKGAGPRLHLASVSKRLTCLPVSRDTLVLHLARPRLLMTVSRSLTPQTYHSICLLSISPQYIISSTILVTGIPNCDFFYSTQ